MEKLKLVTSGLEQADLAHSAATGIGRVVDVPEPGWLALRLDGAEPCRARMVQSLAERDPATLVGREVLVTFPGNDPAQPVALDVLHTPGALTDTGRKQPGAEEGVKAELNGKQVVIKADERLELRVGKASIIIDDEGKITIRGAHLLNRATGPIRIKGGHVDIN